MFAVIRYDPEYIRLGDDNEDVSGWLVDYVGTEQGAREFLADVEPENPDHKYYLMQEVAR